MNTTLIRRSLGRSGLVLKRNSPEIFLGLGIVGGIVAAVMAAKATLKAEEIINHHKVSIELIEHVAKSDNKPEEYTEEVQARDIGLTYVKTGLAFARLYGPAIGVGVLSIASILASHGVMKNRQVALIAAYNVLSEGWESYRKNVISEFGEEKDKELMSVVVDQREMAIVDAEAGKPQTTRSLSRKAKSIYSRFFDNGNPEYRSDRQLNKAFLLAQQNYANDVLAIRGHVFLNEVYERLGFPHTKEGQIVGWLLKDAQTMRDEGRDGYIDFGLYDFDDQPGREFVNGTNDAILLDFNVDGIVFDLI